MIGILLVGVPIYATVLSRLTEAFLEEENQRNVDFAVDLTSNKIKEICTLRRTLSQLRSGMEEPLEPEGEGDCRVSEYDFLCFFLVNNDVLSMDEIGEIMTQFYVRDRNKSGHISLSDSEDSAASTIFSGDP